MNAGAARRALRMLGMGALTLALVLLQRQIWFSRDSVSANAALRARIRILRGREKMDRFRDSLLHAEVRNLESERGALEAAVRYNLGYIRPRETFYQVIMAPPPRAALRTSGRTRSADIHKKH